MRAVLFFQDGRAIDQVATFPPQPRMTVKNYQGAAKSFRLVRGSWAPVSEAQLAVYEEVPARKHLTAHKEREAFAEWQGQR